MTYGAKIYNTSGQAVIDSDNVTYLLSQQFTLSGTLIQNSYVETDLFSYSFSNMPEDALPAFVNLQVGHFLGGQTNGYISTQSSLTFLSLKPSSQISNPVGYDVVFYNAQGQKTWVASSAVAVMNNFATIPALGTFSSNADYVALLTRLPYFLVQGLVGRSLSTGVLRQSSTSYAWAARTTGAAPAIQVGPYPVSVLLAKSG